MPPAGFTWSSEHLPRTLLSLAATDSGVSLDGRPFTIMAASHEAGLLHVVGRASTQRAAERLADWLIEMCAHSVTVEQLVAVRHKGR